MKCFIRPVIAYLLCKFFRIYCGYENMIEIFDVQRPGQASQKIPTIPQKRTKEGQKGIRR